MEEKEHSLIKTGMALSLVIYINGLDLHAT